MKTTVVINKNDYPQPGAVASTLVALGIVQATAPAAQARILDAAIHQLRQFRELLIEIYGVELNDDTGTRRALQEGIDYILTEGWDANGSPVVDSAPVKRRGCVIDTSD